MDMIGNQLVGFATLIGAIWSGTEFLPRAFKKLGTFPKERLALALGVVAGPSAYGIGLVSVGDVEGWLAYVAAGFLGVIGTVMAGVGHDYVVKSILKKG